MRVFSENKMQPLSRNIAYSYVLPYLLREAKSNIRKALVFFYGFKNEFTVLYQLGEVISP